MFSLIKDRLLLACFAGVIGTLAAVLSLFLLNLLIPGKTINMTQITYEIFLNPATYPFYIKLLTIVWSTIVGGVYALVYIAALDFTGWDYALLKAFIIVNGAWLFGTGFIMKLLNLTQFVRTEPLSLAVFYVAHLLFAFYLYFLVAKFGNPKRKDA